MRTNRKSWEIEQLKKEICMNPKCFGTSCPDSRLCRTCRDIRDSAIVIGICGGLCALIVCAAKIGRLI